MTGNKSASAAERAERRLDSWKEIAHFLNRDVRTVQRWEKEENLPVHRHLHLNRSSVFAFEDELESWLENGGSNQAEEETGRFPVILGYSFLGLTIVAVLAGLLLVAYPDTGNSPSQAYADPFPKPVTGLPGHEVNPSLSPTGAQVAFSWNGPDRQNDDIYVQEILGGNPSRITTKPAQEFSPSWSPKGDQIAFLRVEESQQGSIVLINPVSRVERTLTEVELPPADWGPQITWTPDGSTLIAAARWRKRAPFSLAAIDPGTGKVTELTRPSSELQGDFCPSLDPEGKRLALVRNIGPQFGDLFLIDLPAGELRQEVPPRRITRLRTEIRGITWVPSGEQIIFSGGAWPRSTLWRVDPSGTKRAEPLVVAGTSAYDPVISAARTLVFSHFHSRCSLWKIDLSTGGPGTPFLAPSASIGLPEYSRNQEMLVFTSDQSGWPELWLQNLKGGITSRLTAFEAAHTGHTSWSPNGRTVVFDSTVDGDTELFLIDVESPSPLQIEDALISPYLTQLTNNSVEDRIPRWSRDGESIYFSSNRSGRFEIWKMPAGGGAEIQVTKEGGYAAVDSSDGRDLYFSKWNEHGLWSMALTTGRPELVRAGRYSDFTIAGDRLYYVTESNRDGHHYEVAAIDLVDGRSHLLFSDDARYGGSMTVSPKGTFVTLARYDEESADLMMVNGFHCRRLAGETGDGVCPSCAAELSGFSRLINRLKFWSR